MENKGYRTSKAELMTLLAVFGGFGDIKVRKQSPEEIEAIKIEYELIQQKKSKLTASQRRSIVHAYERLANNEEVV